jgi:hypothetical protein
LIPKAESLNLENYVFYVIMLYCRAINIEGSGDQGVRIQESGVRIKQYVLFWLLATDYSQKGGRL